MNNPTLQNALHFRHLVCDKSRLNGALVFKIQLSEDTFDFYYLLNALTLTAVVVSYFENQALFPSPEQNLPPESRVREEQNTEHV